MVQVATTSAPNGGNLNKSAVPIAFISVLYFLLRFRVVDLHLVDFGYEIQGMQWKPL